MLFFSIFEQSHFNLIRFSFIFIFHNRYFIYLCIGFQNETCVQKYEEKMDC